MTTEQSAIHAFIKAWDGPSCDFQDIRAGLAKVHAWVTAEVVQKELNTLISTGEVQNIGGPLYPHYRLTPVD